MNGRLERGSLRMHYLLIHSPLVTELCWEAIVPLLKDSGATVSCINSTPQPDLQGSYHNGYLAQISSALANLTVNDQPSNVVVVAHSGAGCWLTAMDPRKVRSYVFLDAIFSLSEASRFDLFDDPRTVNAWRSAAAASAERLPSVYCQHSVHRQVPLRRWFSQPSLSLYTIMSKSFRKRSRYRFCSLSGWHIRACDGFRF